MHEPLSESNSLNVSNRKVFGVSEIFTNLIERNLSDIRDRFNILDDIE